MRKIILGFSILSIILTAGIIAVEASSDNLAWRETIKEKMAEFKGMTPEERKAQKEEVQVAMEELKNNEEWQEANKERKIEMMKELDVFPLRAFGRAMGQKFNKENFSVNHKAVKDAIEAGDYKAWSEAVEGRKCAEIITEENFEKLVKAHNLMKEGDKKGAKDIMEEIGINRSPNAMHSFANGFKRGYFHGQQECRCD